MASALEIFLHLVFFCRSRAAVISAYPCTSDATTNGNCTNLPIDKMVASGGDEYGAEEMQVSLLQVKPHHEQQGKDPVCSSGLCGKYVRDASCQCNSKCVKYDNCCGDYKSSCLSTTCKGACDTYIKGKPCQCNGNCFDYNTCCEDYTALCLRPSGTHVVHRNLTVYHQTSPEICKLILAGEFKIGKGGLCGKGIYFAMTPEATRTKAITASSEGGCMIKAIVDVGRMGNYVASDTWARHGEKSCGAYSSMNLGKLLRDGYDTIKMTRGDGDEIILFEPQRVLHKEIIDFDCKWMCGGRCKKHWPAKCHHWR